jgi:hypothetical protein
MEAVRSSEELVGAYQTIWKHTSEDSKFLWNITLEHVKIIHSIFSVSIIRNNSAIVHQLIYTIGNT